MTTVSHTWFLAKRHTLALLRQPWFVAISLVQPLIWLLLFGQLFQQVAALPGFPADSYLAYLTPGIVIMTAMFANSWNGMGLIDDMHRGILDRFLASTVRRSALLSGIAVREALSMLLQAGILIGIALLMGGYFPGGPIGLVVLLAAAMLIGTVFGNLSMGMALSVRQREAVIGLNQFLVLPGLFLSTAFMPGELLPNWIATVTAYNPVDWAVVAAREALLASQPDWGSIASRLGLLALVVMAASWLANRAFGNYQRSI